MTEPKNTRRIEETDDGRLRVVVKSKHELYGEHPEGRPNALTHEYGDFWTWTVPKKGGPERVRVGTAAHTDETDGWFIDGAHGIYADVPVDERELTDAEQAWVDGGLVNRNAESVIEFTIPHPEDLRSAILDEDLGRFDCLDAVIEDSAKRNDVLTSLQERIADEHVRSNQLSRKGIQSDLYPEWNPDDDHNDGKSREHLHDMASMRNDAHLTDFKTVVGFDYACFRNARWRVLELHEPNLDPYEHVPLDVAGYPEWTYCRECGAVAPEDVFLHVDLARRDYERRVCERCADQRADWDHAVNYTPENVARAKDERAQSNGGQRNLSGEYE